MKIPALLLFLASSTLAAEPVIVIGGKPYRDATVSAEPGMTVKITHAAGTARVRAWELDAALQRRLGFDPPAVESERLRIVEETRRRAEMEKQEAELRREAEEKRLAEKVKTDAEQAEVNAKAAREWKVKERQRRERDLAEEEQMKRDFEAWRAGRQSNPEAAKAALQELLRRRYLEGK